MATARMKPLRAQEWGEQMAEAAKQWAGVLAPNTSAQHQPPTTLMLVFDRKGVLQGWFALWSMLEGKQVLRVVKWRAIKQAHTVTMDDSNAMSELERYIETVRPTNRYWLCYNRKLKRYEDFKD